MKNYFSNFKLSNANYTLLLSVFITLIPNIAIYTDVYHILEKLDNFSVGFVISIPFFFIFSYNIIFNAVTWPFITKPISVILILLSCVLFFAEYNYGIFFDRNMVQNIFETDSSEATSYFSWFALLWFVMIGILPSVIFSCIQIKKESAIKFILKKILYVIASAAGIVLIAAMFYQDYASVIRNNKYLGDRMVPASFIHSTIQYLHRTYFTKPIPYTQIGLDAHQTPEALKQAQSKPTLLIMVLGETARAQNYQVNGYQRDTTPYTNDLTNMIRFKDAASCGTATAISVPCMFSRMDRKNLNLAKAPRQDNVLDIFKRAGIDVLWKENDGGDKRVAQHVRKITLDPKQKSPLCDGSTCYDMALLNNLDQQINQMKGNRVIVLHLIGSHGPTYYRRYPPKMSYYKPTCNRADIENCSVQQIKNTYDNTLRYTDFVLKTLVNKLKSKSSQFNTALIYMSDHGESLGEDGIFLHGAPYSFAPIYQRRVPLMVWLSPGIQKESGINLKCMKSYSKKTDYFSQDNLFDSLLGIMDVKTSIYRPQQDIFNYCRH
ncbi:phosphoethanolamine transferase [Celerinatantimonas diazotrophica]|uniref:Phosphatidylethanolamine:Kdo2-lipid A phosphoethanolamine transferase n=1 Tax=Celerinatantimonas diazotrophica TaxID=412034 RepID=A0A4R1JLZ3_9GAMM|nr:phosphoethanolamine--lipid A transferase [Celerinatantimonas diazotrophica]TCK52063.1 phosphatidylethanolamine:Kdo2-lipid A phosphoethanolamine transferase [Celerinatantimonas diazotrophica]CAG9296234.1 Phosphoethanolamine transferase EptA [Celerinatantimonas diazotrophica]